MLKMPPPVDPTVTYVEGYYWIQNLKLGSVGVMLYTDGRWHRHDYQTEDIGVVEGPLQPPTEQQRASQDAYFAAATQKERASFGDIKDPSWFDWVDGYYWVQWDDQEPEVALVVEDRWQSVSFVNGDNEGSVANFAGARRDSSTWVRVETLSDFKGRHFAGEVVLWAVRWYCRYGVSYRDLEQMLGERGVSVDHSTIYRWVQKYAPEIERRLRWQWRRPRSTSWRVDETYIYIKVRGKWTYLYRAVDKFGNTIDFYLSPTRNTAAAKRFLGKALAGLKDWEKPTVINTDKAPTYGAALAELKKEGKCPDDTVHRQVKYLNNVVEADHGKLKQLIRPVRGFKTLKTACATIKGFEVMRALRKGQAGAFNITRDICGEARLVERAFRLGSSALSEVFQLITAGA